jgi:hypothetical protein
MNHNLVTSSTEYKYSTNVGLKFFNTVHLLLAFLVIAWMSNGLFTYIMPFVPNFIRWGMFVIWFVFAFIKSKSFTKRFFKQCWPLLLFLIYLFFLSVFQSENYMNTYFIPFSYLLIVYSIFLYYHRDEYKKYQKFLVSYLFFECIFIAVNTYIKLRENPLLSRILTAGHETAESFLGTSNFQGVGSYAFFYALVPVILLLGFIFVNFRKKKMLILITIIAFVTVLIKASFTLAILLFFVFLSITIIIKYTKNYFFTILLFLAILFILVFQGILTSLFHYLSSINGISAEVSIRFHELYAFFSGKPISGGDLDGRIFLYKMSIDAFLNNFITGISIPVNQGYSAGNHSAWLDLLAHFGLFSFPFFIFLINAYKFIKTTALKNFKTFITIYWSYFFVVGTVNTLFFASIFTIWFLFLPFAIKTLSKSKEVYN